MTAVDSTTGAWVPPQCTTSRCLAVFGVMMKYARDPFAQGDPVIEMMLANAPQDIGPEVGGGKLFSIGDRSASVT